MEFGVRKESGRCAGRPRVEICARRGLGNRLECLRHSRLWQRQTGGGEANVPREGARGLRRRLCLDHWEMVESSQEESPSGHDLLDRADLADVTRRGYELSIAERQTDLQTNPTDRVGTIRTEAARPRFNRPPVVPTPSRGRLRVEEAVPQSVECYAGRKDVSVRHAHIGIAFPLNARSHESPPSVIRLSEHSGVFRDRLHP